MHIISIGPDGIQEITQEQIEMFMAAARKHEATRGDCDCVSPENDVEPCRVTVNHPDAPKHSGCWHCTRPKGHEGKHRACGVGIHNRHEWEEEGGFEA